MGENKPASVGGKGEGASALDRALLDFFGAGKLPRALKKLSGELLAIAELEKRGFEIESVRNVGTDNPPSILLKGGLKVEVRVRNEKSPSGLPDFSIKKNSLRFCDAVLCLDSQSGEFFVFTRGEVKDLWLDGEIFCEHDYWYFYPWKSEEEAKDFCEKTRKGRSRAWGKVFANKDRVLESATGFLKKGREGFVGNFETLKTAQVLEPDEKEKTPEDKFNVEI